MATPQDEFTVHCMELLAALGVPRARRMFSGRGLYVDDVFVALIFDERLYLKTDEASREAFRTSGSEPFSYATRDGERTNTSYWSAPEDAMDSPAQMLPWARLAMASALRAQAAKRPARASKPRAAKPRAPGAKRARKPA